MQHTRRVFLATVGGTTLAGCLGGGEVEEAPDDDGETTQDEPSADETPDDDGTAEEDESEEDSRPEVESVSLLLNWRINGLHAPYFAALDQGFYEEAGFDDVEIESGEGSDFAATQAGLGNVEFAISSSDQVLNVNSQDLSPRSVGAVMQRNPVVVFAAREHFGELEEPDQLGGVTLGSGPGMVRQMTEAFLEHHDLLDDVEYVDSGFDTVQQLLTGEIDAAGGVFSDVVDAEHQGYEIDVLSVHETVPSYGHLVAVAEEFGEENPETVRAFLRATARGAVWANQHPEEAIDVLVDAQPELEEVRENQRDKWEAMRTEYMLSDAVRERGWGWMESEPWQRTQETLAAGDFFEGEVDPEAVWTNDYLDTDDEYVGEYADLVEE